MTRSNLMRAAVAIAILIAGLAGSIVASQRSASAMAKATTALLDSLTPEQRQKMALPFDSTDRTRWHFIPTNQFPRHGVPLKELNESQRKLAHELLKSALSQRGYTTTVTVMNDLEGILRDTEAAARAAKGTKEGGQVRDPELYYFAVFGTPGGKAPWGWRVEGHHISLHFTIGGGSTVAAAPSFWGSNPAEVREGAKKG